MSFFSIVEGIPSITKTSVEGSVAVTEAEEAQIIAILDAGGEVSISNGAFVIDKLSRDPVATEVPSQITFSQLLIGLVAEGWISEAEGEAWLTGTIPAAATTLINTLPSSQRFGAKARVLRPSVVLRSDSLVSSLSAAAGKDSTDLDNFFTTYSQV